MRFRSWVNSCYLSSRCFSGSNYEMALPSKSSCTNAREHDSSSWSLRGSNDDTIGIGNLGNCDSSYEASDSLITAEDGIVL